MNAPSNIESIEEKLFYSSAKGNGEYGVRDSFIAMGVSASSDMLLLAHYVDQDYGVEKSVPKFFLLHLLPPLLVKAYRDECCANPSSW